MYGYRILQRAPLFLKLKVISMCYQKDGKLSFEFKTNRIFLLPHSLPFGLSSFNLLIELSFINKVHTRQNLDLKSLFSFFCLYASGEMSSLDTNYYLFFKIFQYFFCYLITKKQKIINFIHNFELQIKYAGNIFQVIHANIANLQYYHNL